MTTLRELAADLRHAGESVLDEAEKVVSKGALNIKNDWRDRWEGHAHIPDLPRAITYDVDRREGDIRAEIGPDKERKQGPLGNIIEYGTINNAPIPGGHPALDAELPRFDRAVADLGEKLLS